MPDSLDSGPGLGEIARRVQEIFNRFQEFANKLDTAVVTKEYFSVFERLLNEQLKNISDHIDVLAKDLEDKAAKVPEKADKDITYAEIKVLKDRVSVLEDDKKWLTRLILGFIFLGIMAAVYGASKLGGG